MKKLFKKFKKLFLESTKIRIKSLTKLFKHLLKVKTILILPKLLVIIKSYLEPLFYIKVLALTRLNISSIIYLIKLQRFLYFRLNLNLFFIEILRTVELL